MSRSKFDFEYVQMAYLTQRLLMPRIRASLVRVKSKLLKIDMALKVVLRRSTRKNNPDYQENMYELAQLLQKVEASSGQEQESHQSLEGRQFYF